MSFRSVGLHHCTLSESYHGCEEGLAPGFEHLLFRIERQRPRVQRSGSYGEDAQSASVGGGKNYEPTTPEAHQDIFHVMVAPLRREDGGSRGSVSCSSAGAGRVSGGVAAPSATSKVAASSRSTNLTTSSGAMRPTGIVEALAAREVDRLGGGWAWDVHTKAAHVLTMSEIHYGSPTFRLAMRTPEGDFWQGGAPVHVVTDHYISACHATRGRMSARNEA